MAKIGLKNFYFSVATEDASTGALTYSGATKPGKAISFTFEPNVSDATLYADDAVAERDSSVNGGTCTMGIDREDPQMYATLLGHDENDGIVTSNVNDVAPYVGLARIVTLMVDGALKYRAVFLPKVKFQEPSADNSTKGETTEFGTYEIEGTVMPNGDGDWRKEQIFDTQAAADAWIASLLSSTGPLSE